MSYIQERTCWSADEQRRTPDSFWPPGLLRESDRRKLKSMPVQKMHTMIDAKFLQAIAGAK